MVSPRDWPRSPRQSVQGEPRTEPLGTPAGRAPGGGGRTSKADGKGARRVCAVPEDSEGRVVRRV